MALRTRRDQLEFRLVFAQLVEVDELAGAKISPFRVHYGIERANVVGYNKRELQAPQSQILLHALVSATTDGLFPDSQGCFEIDTLLGVFGYQAEQLLRAVRDSRPSQVFHVSRDFLEPMRAPMLLN